MKKHIITFVVLFLAVACVFAQQPNKDSVLVQANTLLVQIESMQAQIQGFKVQNQSDRLEYYDTLRKISRAKSQYYILMASISPDQTAAAGCRQTAWHQKRKAEAYDQKFYSALATNNIKPVHLGKLAF